MYKDDGVDIPEGERRDGNDVMVLVVIFGDTDAEWLISMVQLCSKRVVLIEAGDCWCCIWKIKAIFENWLLGHAKS